MSFDFWLTVQSFFRSSITRKTSDRFGILQHKPKQSALDSNLPSRPIFHSNNKTRPYILVEHQLISRAHPLRQTRTICFRSARNTNLEAYNGYLFQLLEKQAWFRLDRTRRCTRVFSVWEIQLLQISNHPFSIWNKSMKRKAEQETV